MSLLDAVIICLSSLLRQNRPLGRLTLKSGVITKPYISDLGRSLRYNHELQELELLDVSLCSQGLRNFLISLGENEHLEKLALSVAKIHDECVFGLCDIILLCKTSLKRIDLGESAISEMGIEALLAAIRVRMLSTPPDHLSKG